MDVTDQTILEERSDASTKAILLLLNSKNDNTKKDLRLSYPQENKSAYQTTVKAMARYLSTQYPNKTIGHQRDKKEGMNRKKGHAFKPEDKDNNAIGTVGAHIGEVTTLEDHTAPSNESSIGAHVSEVAKHKSQPAQSIEDLLGAQLINDAIRGFTDPTDVSIETTNSAEIMTSSHIRGE